MKCIILYNNVGLIRWRGKEEQGRGGGKRGEDGEGRKGGRGHGREGRGGERRGAEGREGKGMLDPRS